MACREPADPGGPSGTGEPPCTADSAGAGGAGLDEAVGDRPQQQDGQLAWGSPLWIDYAR